MRYCAHNPCSKPIIQRSNENVQEFDRRRFCSSYCSDRKSNAPVAHGTLRGVKNHWMRDEKPCDLCSGAIHRELARTSS
jgi:hypothetical protein